MIGINRIAAAWWLPLGCFAAVVTLDHYLFVVWHYWQLGLIDEPAHLLTSVIIILAVVAAVPSTGHPANHQPAQGQSPAHQSTEQQSHAQQSHAQQSHAQQSHAQQSTGRWPGWAVTCLIAGNLIDADHLPQILGSDALTAGTPRPYSHSLATVALLVALGITSRTRARAADPFRSRASGIFFGAALGVSGHLLRDGGTSPIAVFWPVSDQAVSYPHTAYLAGLLLLATIPLVARLVSRPLPQRS